MITCTLLSSASVQHWRARTRVLADRSGHAEGSLGDVNSDHQLRSQPKLACEACPLIIQVFALMFSLTLEIYIYSICECFYRNTLNKGTQKGVNYTWTKRKTEKPPKQLHSNNKEEQKQNKTNQKIPNKQTKTALNKPPSLPKN